MLTLDRYKVFEFTKYEYNEDNVLKLYYKIDNNLEFIEEINFNPNKIKLRELNLDEKKALDLAFKYLHLVAGVSYYKLLLPDIIKIDTISLTKDQKEFFDKLYLKGLGEFACRNNIDLREKINFPYDDMVKNESSKINLNDDFIVPIGGGKDSMVTLELLKQNVKNKLNTFCVNNLGPIKDCCEMANCDNIYVTRKISPLLLEINKDLVKFGAFNGHVPITSIIIFISVCAGIIYNCNTTVISSENSANVGNLIFNGMTVNHQWSKSFEAELMINNFIQKYVVMNFNYFSLLRPFSELQIAKMFAKIGKYNKVFSSCNKNFKISKIANQKRWCNDCDKCRFVFLIFAPFIKKDELIEIFGENLLSEDKQYEGYKELTGLTGYKPFECVGEIEECIVAFSLLEKTEFKDDLIVVKIIREINERFTSKKIKELEKKYFTFHFENTLLPKEIEESIKQCQILK